MVSLFILKTFPCGRLVVTAAKAGGLWPKGMEGNM